METETQKMQAELQSSYIDHGTKVCGGFSINTVTTCPGEANGEISHQHEENEKPSPVPDLYFNSSNSFLYTPNGPIGIAIKPKEGVQEIYLTKMFVMLPNHEFYCPSCKVSVEKVLFCKIQEEIIPPVSPEPPHSEPPTTEPPVTQPPVVDPPVIDDYPVRCSACFSFLVQKGKQLFNRLVPCAPGSSPDTSIDIPESPGPLLVVSRQRNSKGWEILKSIVYGGLTELLASLSIVTSAASADATTLNIFALGIANLVGGLFVLGHNLKDLKTLQPREEDSETDAPEDKYYELLGKRENFFLHAFVAILSFLIFGFVPPVVYGFSFYESNDKDLKLAAVAGASLLCITLLAIAKAHIKSPNNCLTYFKTVSFYVTSGVLASLLTYVAGSLMRRLVEHLGWFEPRSNFGLSLPEMSIERPRWSYY